MPAIFAHVPSVRGVTAPSSAHGAASPLMMTYQRFEQLWIQAGLDDLKPVANATIVDNMSPHMIDALVAASDGDFTAFDRAAEICARS